MKKNVLMIMIIGLLVLPAYASNLADQLCEDETFVTFVEESVALREHLKSLDGKSREDFLLSEEMSCLLETQAKHVMYTHEILRGFEGDKSVVIREAISKVTEKVTKNCDTEYAMANSFCYMVFQLEVGEPGSPQNQYAYYHLQECLAAAALQYAICGGGVV